MNAIIIFRLQSDLVTLHPDDRRVKEKMGRNEGHEGTLVSDLFAEETNVQAVPPRCSVGIGDGLCQFVGKYIVSGIGEGSVRCVGPYRAAGHVREGFYGVEKVSDVIEVHAAVISAKYVRGTHRKGGVKAFVLAGRNKNMVNVTVAGISGHFGCGVHNGLNVGIDQRSC